MPQNPTQLPSVDEKFRREFYKLFGYISPDQVALVLNNVFDSSKYQFVLEAKNKPDKEPSY